VKITEVKAFQFGCLWRNPCAGDHEVDQLQASGTGFEPMRELKESDTFLSREMLLEKRSEATHPIQLGMANTLLGRDPSTSQQWDMLNATIYAAGPPRD